jgi:predicted AAA+ superfamily ATPase
MNQSHPATSTSTQLRGISLERMRRDRILQEAPATAADPVHLRLVFNIDRTNATAYANAARNLLNGPAEQALLPGARNEHQGAVRARLPG